MDLHRIEGLGRVLAIAHWWTWVEIFEPFHCVCIRIDIAALYHRWPVTSGTLRGTGYYVVATLGIHLAHNKIPCALKCHMLMPHMMLDILTFLHYKPRAVCQQVTI